MFGVIWCCCFLPTVLGLIWFQMWSVVIAGAILVVMAGLVPIFAKLRSTPPPELSRSIELTPVGKREKCGDSTTFVKWNSIDEILETDTDFLFTRNSRFTMLPKRVVGDENLQTIRDQIAFWRNQPEGATEPIEMYRRLFQSVNTAGSQIWSFKLSREDLIAATRSTTIRPISESTFSFKDVDASIKSRRWISILLFGLILKVAFLLIYASLPPNKLEWLPLVLFLCFNPFVLLIAMGFWIRWRGIKSVPRFTPEEYQVRLCDGGWAIGNEDLVAFNIWNHKSILYLAAECVGIRSDLALIHVMPSRAFGGKDGLWQFLDRAIRLKKAWLQRKSDEGKDTQTAIEVDNGEQPDEPVNPYRSPSVNSG